MEHTIRMGAKIKYVSKKIYEEMIIKYNNDIDWTSLSRKRCYVAVQLFCNTFNGQNGTQIGWIVRWTANNKERQTISNKEKKNIEKRQNKIKSTDKKEYKQKKKILIFI